jgi:hypothetical protein
VVFILKVASSHNTATKLFTPNAATSRSIEGIVMRDIRDDLKERADFIENQIRAAHAHFEKMVQQVQSERDARIADLKGALTVIHKLREFEDRHVGNGVTLDSPSALRHSLADRIKAASG